MRTAGEGAVSCEGRPVETVRPEAGIVEFETAPGHVHRLSPV
ncbi:hypothetical protein [Streptomyces sp. CNQ085]|nr:hypothetical protein [Streptomyces sp. CNQ085]